MGSCSAEPPVEPSTDLWFRADDDGTGSGTQTECKENNDLTHLPEAECGDGPK